MILRYYRTPVFSQARTESLLRAAKTRINRPLHKLYTELGYYAQTARPLTSEEEDKLRWYLAEPSQPTNFSDHSFLAGLPDVIEVGPRLNFETADSTTAVQILRSWGIAAVTRLESSVRFGTTVKLDQRERELFLDGLYDHMTHMPYPQPLVSFETGMTVQPVQTIPLLENGLPLLRALNQSEGYAWDEQDIAMVWHLFAEILRRDPTDVELFQIAQSITSEHSRHPFFKGVHVVDGVERRQSLIELVQQPWKQNPGNSLVAFGDDSAAIAGYRILALVPEKPGEPCRMVVRKLNRDFIHTEETHNHPSMIEPFQGGATGPGGGLRDLIGDGLGGIIGLGGAGYCVSHLDLPGYPLPWEKPWQIPKRFAHPRRILIEASNGVTGYGNCFGEPLTGGFARSFGLKLPEGSYSFVKPIVYTARCGQIDLRHLHKGKPQAGMWVMHFGGPKYRIGIGGAARSSAGGGEGKEDLDWNSVQRANPYMEQLVYRLFLACSELGEANPFAKVGDLGAGGLCNQTPELATPAGARITLQAIPTGDPTLSTLEVWGCEAQEGMMAVVWETSLPTIARICEREGIPYSVIGTVTGDGRIVVADENCGSTPVDLPLEPLLESLPRKTYSLDHKPRPRKPLVLPGGLTIEQALDRVFRLVDVGSKRFLTSKGDRSVGGLVAQQQCVGPHQLPLCGYSVMAQSYFSLTGCAYAYGERPGIGLIDPKAMARLAVAEAILNLSGAKITMLSDIKCAANWMWAAKLAGEGALLRDAAEALSQFCIDIGIAVDRGKDSSSMWVKLGEEIVKAPGELVIAALAPMDDITRKITPDLKSPGNALVYVDLGWDRCRLGGSALARCFDQIGDTCPDIGAGALATCFEAVQQLIAKGLVCSLHDVSDGGLIATILEMAISGNFGVYANVKSRHDLIETYFHEEPGLVLETPYVHVVVDHLRKRGLSAYAIGKVGEPSGVVRLWHDSNVVYESGLPAVRALWESTATELEKLQADPACVEEEATMLAARTSIPPYTLTFTPTPTPPFILEAATKPKVALVREQGNNGDREMCGALYAAGFEVWDVLMADIASGAFSLETARGAVFPGGFTFKDVGGSAKGWAGVARFNPKIAEEFRRFFARPDTFSLGVCNGCQFMALAGIAPFPKLPEHLRPRLLLNRSERFESRWVTVKILPGPSIFFRNMEGSSLGVWIAHGEGRVFVPNDAEWANMQELGLAQLRFVDDSGNPTENYPFNPNGSPEGVAGFCTPDGRHLAIMPHPERACQLWQWPWLPKGWEKLPASPWLAMFQNAFRWCAENR